MDHAEAAAEGLRASPRSFAAHFATGTLGHALCEGDTWLSSKQIDDRFGTLLQDHLGKPVVHLLPEKSSESRLLDILFQLRHSIVHNVGVITATDAAKLRLLCRRHVEPGVLKPTRADVWYARLFLGAARPDYRQVAAVVTVLFRHSLIHQDEMRRLRTRGHDVEWLLSLGRKEKHLRVEKLDHRTVRLDFDLTAFHDDLLLLAQRNAEGIWWGRPASRYRAATARATPAGPRR